MSLKTCQLKVEDLPLEIKKNQLKVVFRNDKKQGGGHVSDVDLDESTNSAVITFVEKEAVAKVLQRGQFVEIFGRKCRVYGASNDVSEYSTRRDEATPQKASCNIIVKISIKDCSVSRCVYEYYIEDFYDTDETCTVNDIYMDGLERAVYVQVLNAEVARKLCAEEGFDTPPNIKSIELAEGDVFEHYPNLISIHGMDFSTEDEKKKLKQYIEKKINLSPTVKSGEEPCSVILEFDKKVEDLNSKAWDCVGKLDDIQLVTAPVRKSSTIVAHVDGNLDKETVRRYFQSKKRGGGPTSNFEEMNDDTFLVTFKDINVASSVVSKKNHMVGESKIEAQIWHHCLSKDAYHDYCIPQGGNVENTIQEAQQYSESIDLKELEYGLLRKDEFITSLGNSHSSAAVDTNDVNRITIKGHKQSVEDLTNKIKEKMKDFTRIKMDGLDDLKHSLVLESSVQKMVNDLLDKAKKMAYIYSLNKALFCYFDSEKEDAVQIKNFVDDSIFCFVEEFSVETIAALTSEKGRQFISDLEKNAETLCRIKVKEEKRKLEICTLDENGCYFILNKIQRFVQHHKMDTKSIEFPALKYEYILTYLQKEFNKIEESLKSSGGSMKMDDGRFTIEGYQSAIDKAADKLSSIRERITIDEQDLRFFGISEYFASVKGNNILKEIGKDHHCLIVPKGAKLKSSQLEGTLVGSCDMGKLQVKFVCGDITSLDVDVIVNPVDNRLHLKSGFNKNIVQKGGEQIQRQLKDFKAKPKLGDVIETDGGQLPCSSIFHLVMESDAKDILCFVKDVFTKADHNNLKSIALPLIGCGRFKIPEAMVSLNIFKGVKHFSEKASSVNEITICDMDPNHIGFVISHFKNDAKVNLYCSLKYIGLEDPEDHSEGKKADESTIVTKFNKLINYVRSFRGASFLTLKQGDILQEKCDAVVCGVKDDMDLKSGGAVSRAILRHCGASLQAECEKKVTEMKQSGAVCVSAKRLPCSAIIFVSTTQFSHCWGQGVDKVLSLAEENGHKIVALPAFGTGMRNANIPKLKQTILSAINQFEKDSNPKNLKEVRLVVFDTNVFQVFNQSEGDDSPHNRKHHREQSVQHQKKKMSSDVNLSSIVPRTEVSDKVTLQIVYYNHEERMKSITELTKKCENNLITRSFPFEKISEISQQKIDDIITIGLKKQVQVKKATGCFIFVGFNEESIQSLKNDIFVKTLDATKEQVKQELNAIKTAFKWQFMKFSSWEDFDSELNLKIDKAFKSDCDNIEFTGSNNKEYKIDFKIMKEYRWSDKSKKWRELTTVNRYDLNSEKEKLPDHWEKMGAEDVKLVALSSTSSEYQEIKFFFESNGASVPIKKIERIQNEMLYKQYTYKRKHFEEHNPKGTQNEKRLFHGTDHNAVANINASGFNRSFCGKNATAYGKGVYFAVKSSYSINYTKADAQGNQMMYVAKVLVGESTTSNCTMDYLPTKPEQNVPYDSGYINNVMYIIFNDSQAYPEYLITF